MKTYLIFLNQPNSIMHEYQAKSKHDALKQYNAETRQTYKITSDISANLFVVEKKAWCNYQFSAISRASIIH